MRKNFNKMKIDRKFNLKQIPDKLKLSCKVPENNDVTSMISSFYKSPDTNFALSPSPSHNFDG